MPFSTTTHVRLINLVGGKIPTPRAKILCQTPNWSPSYPNLGWVGHNIDSRIIVAFHQEPEEHTGVMSDIIYNDV